ncbi:Ferredoxin-NADP reductase [Rhizobium sp. RU20A]|uniref:FAD-binding oxidoreductase n=1 Tax=Rhizobium sp. RU20A TaxID=1907412 RepID=UPI0009552DDB|nr:FAD-binding oxidoreductase [Rhizobium sp. RU20A]SIQ95011.1 Ferredoxin-NADP reductase [Rhizobium sp. RU20A]
MTGSNGSRLRPFRLVSKTRESDTITSFVFQPLDESGWQDFEAGQFLTLQVPTQDGASVVRTYTVSSSPRLTGTYRISVKREQAPSADVPSGLCSNWLHDALEPGMVVQAAPPRGGFVLDRTSARPVLLISGGVGITPMMPMFDLLARESDRPVWFIHACENEAVEAFRSEVAALAALRPDLHRHTCYRVPKADPASLTLPRHSSGLLSRATLQALLPLDDYEVYLCGPPPFMQALYALLLSLGVRKERIAYEFFGPASLTLSEETVERAAATTVAGADQPATGVPEGAISVRLGRSGRDLEWTGSSPSLLSFLEEHGIEPAFSCRAAICGTCEQGLIAGDVAYHEEPLDPLAEGRVLLCCSRPVSSIVLDL